MNLFTRTGGAIENVAHDMMGGITGFMRQHPVLVFIAGCFAWVAGVLVLIGDPGSFDAWFWGVYLAVVGLVLMVWGPDA